MALPQKPSHKTKIDKHLFSILVTRIMGSSKKKQLMEELFPDEGAKFTRISDRLKRIITEQGNVEAFDT